MVGEVHVAPGGFDEMLTKVDHVSWLQRNIPVASARRNMKYGTDKVKLDEPALPATSR